MELAVTGIVVFVVVLFVLITLIRTIVIVRQADTAIVERLGRYSRTLTPGLSILVPVIDRIRQRVDMREQVASFPPQPVITEDNLVVSIDTVIYFQVTDPKAATYEISSYLVGIEQLAVTTLRNVIGSMDLEQALTSRDQINGELRGVLDEATGKWGIRVNRVELKAIDPPASVQEAMEKQLKAERERRAAILTAEGQKQAAILNAEGDKQSEVLAAEADAQAAVLRAEGEAKARIIAADAEAQAVRTIYEGLRSADPQPNELAHRYLAAIPEVAKGDANKVWFLPTELTTALASIRAGLSGTGTPPAS
ncbi:MAG: SPFH domain-containing protein [Candidatus Nanopelagicales bacterium]|jgi:regulator of protease activity HflC (stomatin/prohibitin superfamily)